VTGAEPGYAACTAHHRTSIVGTAIVTTPDHILRLTNDIADLRAVRDVMRHWVGHTGPAGDDAILIATELLTNAIRHGHSAPTLAVRLDDRAIRVEVTDDSPTPPALTPDPGAHGGFGLRIVAEASHAWGWRPTPGGKIVWSDIDVLPER
jgi:hypothetical protein